MVNGIKRLVTVLWYSKRGYRSKSLRRAESQRAESQQAESHQAKSKKALLAGFGTSGSGGASEWKIYPFFSDFSGV
jgi:hypothetical protein